MKALREDLKRNAFKRVYLLFGEERYLVNYYANAFVANRTDANDLLMNQDSFYGKEVPAEQIIDAANTLPFMSETRLVYARDTMLFASGRKDDSEAIAAYLPMIPDSTILIFVETEVDKRSRLYKKTAEQGRAVECSPPSEAELINWVINVFTKKGKRISRANAALFLKTVTHSMDRAYAEADKLGDYVGAQEEIGSDDIEAVCSPTLMARIFDLVAAVGNGNVSEALILYRRMLSMKEQPLMILSMIARQFRLILQCRACQAKQMTPPAIATALGLRSFAVTECLRQSKNFSEEKLLAALQDCQDMDVRIKTGRIEGETGAETLIVRYAQKSVKTV